MTRECPDPSPRPRPRPCTLLAPNASFPDGTRLRVRILHTEPDPLVIVTVGWPWGDLEGVEEPAAAVLDSLRIGIR